MATYKCKLAYEREIEANDEDEAEEKFMEEINNLELLDQVDIEEVTHTSFD